MKIFGLTELTASNILARLSKRWKNASNTLHKIFKLTIFTLLKYGDARRQYLLTQNWREEE